MPKRAIEDDGRTPIPALCCECGTRRTINSTRGGNGERATYRCVLDRRCSTCRRSTRHAYLRHDRHRDLAEQEDYRNAGNALGFELDVQIEQLRAVGIRVELKAGSFARDELIHLLQYLDDGTYWVFVNAAAPVARLSAALDSMWAFLMLTDLQGGDGWRIWPADDDLPAMRGVGWVDELADSPPPAVCYDASETA